MHLDLVPDISCIAFVRSLKRFIGRYGTAKLYISDNATCFVGPERLLFNKLEVNGNLYLKRPLGGEGFGRDLFKVRLVQSVKRCLLKILGKSKLSYEELLTVIIEVEGVLNSRLLCYTYDETVEDVLTPSHLIYGRRLLSTFEVEPENMDFTAVATTKRAIYLNTLLAHFWSR